jgi:hypothetical protein
LARRWLVSRWSVSTLPAGNVGRFLLYRSWPGRLVGHLKRYWDVVPYEH